MLSLQRQRRFILLRTTNDGKANPEQSTLRSLFSSQISLLPINEIVADRSPSTVMSEPEQLKDIITPHAHDVLSGRGNFVNHHGGNENFRALYVAINAFGSIDICLVFWSHIILHFVAGSRSTRRNTWRAVSEESVPRSSCAPQ